VVIPAQCFEKARDLGILPIKSAIHLWCGKCAFP
jgi:hypothetical protein